MASRLPTLEQISPTGGLDLDEKWALEMFLGRTMREAEKIVSRNAFTAISVMSAMGSSALAYYIQSTATYFLSEDSSGACDAFNVFLSLVSERLSTDPVFAEQTKPHLLPVLNYCRDHYEKFDLWEGIYGDLRPKIDSSISILEKAYIPKHKFPKGF